jgi:hypothetical protein
VPVRFPPLKVEAVVNRAGPDFWTVRTAGGPRLFDMNANGEEHEAWLRLFITAPEMLTVLYAIEAWIVTLGFSRFTELDQIRRVIRMATGAPRSRAGPGRSSPCL